MNNKTKEVFETNDGIKIEKVSATTNDKKAEQIAQNTKISYGDLVDTVFSYLSYPMGILGNSVSNGKCDICGAKLSYSNRHICPKCWEKYKGKIFEAIKGNASNKVIDLGQTQAENIII